MGRPLRLPSFKIIEHLLSQALQIDAGFTPNYQHMLRLRVSPVY